METRSPPPVSDWRGAAAGVHAGAAHRLAGPPAGGDVVRLARIDPERGAVVSALCLNASIAQYPITDMDSDDAGLLWVATHGGGFICVDPERARCYGLRHSDGRRPVSPPWWRA